MRVVSLLLTLGVLVGILAWRPAGSGQAAAPVPYPEGYRGWTHVKSTLIGPGHPRFASVGGFQHFYANAEAMRGYRSRAFPEGSIVVVDWLELRDSAGAVTEGPRRQVDVMVKDSMRYSASGGWGFQRFVKDSRTEHSATLTPPQCFACHDKLKKDDLVLSTYQP